MSGAYYFAEVDRNGVLCVDQLGEHHHLDEQTITEEQVTVLATTYPDTIYFHHWAGEPSLRN